MREHHDTVIVGGGQAGLAMSAVLQRCRREHVVLERRRVGERWRTERWDSLRFQFPNWSLQLPGYTYTGADPDGFAHYSEILHVIEDYAVSTRAPVREHTEVVGLGEDGDGNGFVVSVADGSISARRVVVATGPFQRPVIPELSCGVSPSVLQTDPTRYRCPGDLPDGAVLVVGSGASGCQIADAPGAGCTWRSAGTGGPRDGSAAGTSTGGWRRWAASPRPSTVSRGVSGPRRSSSPE